MFDIKILILAIILILTSSCSNKSSNQAQSQSYSEMTSKKSDIDGIEPINSNRQFQKSKTEATTEKKVVEETSTEQTQATTQKETVKETEKKVKKKLVFLNSYTTNFDSSKKDRISNIKLASKKLNGTIVKPDEIFSFNQSVGAMGVEQGYKKAVTYVNGKEVENYGGGICQVSTTIYNAVESMGVKIVERHNHSHEVPYAQNGNDAAIAYGSEDFKFKNLNSYPLQLNIKVKKSTITVSVSKVEYI